MQAVAMSPGWYVNQALMRDGAAPGRRLRWPLWCCAALSLAAHAALLDALDGAAHVGRAGGQAMSTHVDARQDRAMRFRMVTAPAARSAAQATPLDIDSTVSNAPLEKALATQASGRTATAHAAPLTATSGAPPAHAATQTDTSETAAAVADAAGALDTMAMPIGPASHGPETYIPRPELTVPPVPQAPVVLSAPEGGGEAARRVAVLSLFIDETGRVHHIVPDEPRLPPSYEQAAREAFMTAAFTPGQLEGRSVKSRIRVEVVFDNTPLAEP